MANGRRVPWLKWLFILLFIGIAGGLIWHFTHNKDDVPQYQTSNVTRGEIVQTVTASGQLNPVVNVQVGSQISGNIQKLFADFNSLVKSNQVVAQLDPATFQASVHQAEGDLANARAGLELAQVNAKRSSDLFQNKLIPQSDNDKALADLHQAEAQVKIKEAALERSKVDLAHCTIFAPVDGIVISRNVDVGQTVAASMNAPVLFVIANDLSKMQIDSNVSEADIGAVEDGQTATFIVDAFPSRTFTGKVTQIRNAPITVQNVVTYDTVIAVDNKDLKLKPGMTATISIITAKKSGVLKVPNAALRFKPLEPATNHSIFARILGSIGFGKDAKTNAAATVASTRGLGTNDVIGATNNAPPPLTGNEPPEELQRRVREMRERGEELPPEIRAKLRELFQSGVLQRPAGGGGPGGGPGGGGGPPSVRPRPAQPSSRTVYTLPANTSPGGDEPPKLQPLRIKTGISDGAFTEVTEGLNEGDAVVVSMKLPQSQAPPPTTGTSPFGGGGRRGF